MNDYGARNNIKSGFPAPGITIVSMCLRNGGERRPQTGNFRRANLWRDRHSAESFVDNEFVGMIEVRFGVIPTVDEDFPNPVIMNNGSGEILSWVAVAPRRRMPDEVDPGNDALIRVIFPPTTGSLLTPQGFPSLERVLEGV